MFKRACDDCAELGDYSSKHCQSLKRPFGSRVDRKGHFNLIDHAL
jgi:hypothetical protein